MLIRDNNDSFEALAYMDPVTNSCQAKTMFIDEVQYSIIDTPSFNLNYGVYLNEIKRLIALIPGVYASEKATEIWQQYIANVCQVQEDKKAAKKEYEENLQNEGKATANKK
ncbi:uncharacterized protein OCT59_016488 [Rhizophagus irregularis]|uniref:uncharacterized protein n=1 Tax=Rhizophagus irregularis TaxID=588596 RepID=UPI00332CFEAB|nr:hypothetical protein OCT59_016488 [Rhizophagus irregularis]